MCVQLGVNDPDVNSMKKLIDKLCERYPDKNIYIEKVFPVGKGYGSATDTLNSKINTYNEEIEEYCKQKEKVFFIDVTDGYVTDEGYLDESMSEDDGVHLTNCDKWLENIEANVITKKETGVQQSEEKNEETKKDKEENGENAEENSTEFQRYPDFSNSEAWKHPYNTYQYGQCTWFAAGRFYEIYGLDPNFPGEGNGCEWVDTITQKYYPDKFTKSDTPVAGSIFSVAASSSNPAGHVGIVIDVQGDQLTIQEGNLNGVSDSWEWAITECTNGSISNPNGDWWERTLTLDELKACYGEVTFANPNGSVSSIGAGRTGTQYYIKIATYKETTEKYETADPDNSAYENEVIYEMSETKINYYDMVKNYTLPFDYLWALMVITEDKDFVFGLADLAYNSDIEITVNDSVSVNTTVKDYTYRKWTRIASSAVLYDGSTISAGDDLFSDQTAKLTTITTTNTVEVALTRANTWIADYTKEYKYQKPETTSSSNGPNNRTDLNEKFPEEYEKMDTNDPLGLKEQAEKENKQVLGVISQYMYANIDWAETTNITINTTKYIGETPKIREKTSSIEKKKEDIGEDGFRYKEKNFVTLLLSNKKAKSNILNVSSWLFEILENNENGSTVDFVDLTKYLLYKVTNRDSWGKTEFDFSIFYPNVLISVSEGDYVVNIDKSPQNIVITDIDKLKKAFAGSGGAGSDNLVAYADDFLEFQEKYRVNAIFAAAVTTAECGAGTNLQIGGNNWFSISDGNGGWMQYSSPTGSIEAFYNLIANGDYYFTQEKYTVKDIGMTYCENADAPGGWIENVLSYMSNMLKAANE